jgi:outer membrane protein OmpA-like peptidoglycan-associated protein
MEENSVRWLLVPVVALPFTLAVSSGYAQSNPSADEIIKKLTPTAQSLTTSSSRGLRMVSPAEAPPAHAAAKPAPAAQQAMTAPAVRPPAASPPAAAAPAVNLTVNFATGSADLTPQAVETLDTLGKALSSDALSRYRFRVEGHTDTVGNDATNLSLSERRAEAVVGYIEQHYGVAAARLQAVGMGSKDPLVPTPPQTAEPKNRRVQIVNIGT